MFHPWNNLFDTFRAMAPRMNHFPWNHRNAPMTVSWLDKSLNMAKKSTHRVFDSVTSIPRENKSGGEFLEQDVILESRLSRIDERIAQRKEVELSKIRKRIDDTLIKKKLKQHRAKILTLFAGPFRRSTVSGGARFPRNPWQWKYLLTPRNEPSFRCN